MNRQPVVFVHTLAGFIKDQSILRTNPLMAGQRIGMSEGEWMEVACRPAATSTSSIPVKSHWVRERTDTPATHAQTVNMSHPTYPLAAPVSPAQSETNADQPGTRRIVLPCTV